jgi:hypothetical protein
MTVAPLCVFVRRVVNCTKINKYEACPVSYGQQRLNSKTQMSFVTKFTYIEYAIV